MASVLLATHFLNVPDAATAAPLLLPIRLVDEPGQVWLCGLWGNDNLILILLCLVNSLMRVTIKTLQQTQFPLEILPEETVLDDITC